MRLRTSFIITGGILLLRFVALDWSWITLYHGYIESFYSWNASHHGFTPAPYHQYSGSWTPRHYGNYFARWVPISASYKIFGEGLWQARLPQLIAYAASTVAAATLAKTWWGPRERDWTLLAYATTPFLLSWSGRVSPEPWVLLGTLIAALGVARIHRAPAWALLYPLGVLLAASAKPVGFLAMFTLALAKRGDVRRILLLASLTLFFAFVAAAASSSIPIVPKEAIESFLTRPKLRWSLPLLGHAFLLGGGGIAWMACVKPNRAWLMMMPLAAYAILDAPINHAYYAYPSLGWVAIAAGRNISTSSKKCQVALTATGLLLIPIHFWSHQELGDRRLEVAESIPLNGHLHDPPELPGLSNVLGYAQGDRGIHQQPHYYELNHTRHYVVSPDGLSGHACYELDTKNYWFTPSLTAWECWRITPTEVGR